MIGKYERKVQYYETDGMKVVHHSNYIRWFEEARLSFMENNGLPYIKLENIGLSIPVLAMHCEYKYPARFNDVIIVETHMTEFNGLRISCEYKIINKETQKLIATGFSKHCFVDINLKPTNLKKDYKDMYNIILNW